MFVPITHYYELNKLNEVIGGSYKPGLCCVSEGLTFLQVRAMLYMTPLGSYRSYEGLYGFTFIPKILFCLC